MEDASDKDIVKDYNLSYDQMLLIEKYDRVFNYLYPILQSVPRKHGVLRNMALECLLRFPEKAYEAAKSNQISKIFMADANLASLRFYLRTLKSTKGMTPHQETTALNLLAEVGKMVGSWIHKKKG